MYRFLYSINNTNNAVLQGVKAMPLKDGCSDGTASFSNDRHLYAETVGTYNDTVQQQLRKKWQGGTRDASEVATKRRVASIGASLNASGNTFSFNSKTEKNTRIDALTRCRGGGACVPQKVRFSPSKTGVPMTNGPPISYTPKHASRTANHAILANHSPWRVYHE